MNPFDRSVITFLNQGAQQWELFDRIVVVLSNSDVVKGAAIMAVFWGLWFSRPMREEAARRMTLLAGVLGSLLALVLARVLAQTLPLRVRPVLADGLEFRPPTGLPDQANWSHWSSFPSDHASLFFALWCGIWLAHRKVGNWLLLYIVFVIALPRIYVGVHYPTDLLAGALLGIGTVVFLTAGPVRRAWAGATGRFFEARPALAHALLFVVSFQIATLFWDLRIYLSHFGFSV